MEQRRGNKKRKDDYTPGEWSAKLARGRADTARFYARNPTKAREYSLRSRASPANRAANLIRQAHHRADEKLLAFDLEDHKDKIVARFEHGVCELTGLRLDFSMGAGRSALAPSIDRIVPEKGYVYSNVRVICFAANALLGNWGDEMAEAVARGFVEHRDIERSGIA